MSRLARKPIKIPDNVDIKIEGDFFIAKGPRGELKRNFNSHIIKTEIKDGAVILNSAKKSQSKESKMLLGTYTSHFKNMIEGVINGFKKKLIIEGVGYKAEVRGKDLVLSLGFSHLVNFPIPQDVSISAEKNAVSIEGIDKEKVGLTASKIRLLKKPEPYKGKGIRYDNEVVKRKAGKKSRS